MKVIGTEIPDVLLLEPRVFRDERGFFLETWNARTFRNEIKLDVQFVQDNHSRSARDVLRGLHYQIRQPQGKLVRVARGQIFDVAVDLRKSRPTFGRWVGHELSEDNHRQLWIPPGFAHGFLVLSEIADVLYKTTDYYAPEHERCLIWNDPEVGIDWPLDHEPVLSAKDQSGLSFAKAEVFRVRLLVTGGNGQVGWELRRSLAAIGDVIALDRKACDLSRPHDLPGLIGEAKPDVIVNAAAYTAVDQGGGRGGACNSGERYRGGRVGRQRRGSAALSLSIIRRITCSMGPRILPTRKMIRPIRSMPMDAASSPASAQRANPPAIT